VRMGEQVLRPSRLVLLLAVASAAVSALVVPGTASARPSPVGAAFRVIVVDQLGDRVFTALAHRGAVGVMRPGFGPTTTRPSAYAELIRGAEINARRAGVPPGSPLIGTDTESISQILRCRMCIVVQLPPRGVARKNSSLFRIAVIGQGFQGLLTSP